MLKVLAEGQDLLTILEEDQRLNNSRVTSLNLINLFNPNDSSHTPSLAIEVVFYTQTNILGEEPSLVLRFEPVMDYSFGPSFTSQSIGKCKFFETEHEYYFSFTPNSSLLEVEQEDTNFVRAGFVQGYTFIAL